MKWTIRLVSWTRRCPSPTLIVAVLLIVAATAFAQTSYIVNDTDATLYLRQSSVDPVELGPDRIFRQVPPGGVLPYDPSLQVGGFIYERGELQFRTLDYSAWVARVGTEGSFSSIVGADLTTARVVSPTSMSAVVSGIRIDNQYLDWRYIESRIARAKARPPMGTYQDAGLERSAIEPDDSLLWGRGGTDLEWLRTATSPDDLYVGVSVYSAFSKATLLFLYLYEPDRQYPSLTIEIPVSSEPGYVLLWEPVSLRPRVVGNVTSTEFFAEAQIWRDTVEETVLLSGDVVIEVATAISAAGAWEEFVLGQMSASELFDL